ncbi:hypothetical protein P7C73_g1875, partial [Tremellales sp. Uapishka_1]
MTMNAGGNMSTNLSLPYIQVDLNMQEATLQWISSAYSLTNGCFLLLAGRLADVHGRKMVFIAGIVWYAIWSLAGGFMQTPVGLVVSRALAGSGAAMSIPSAIGIIASNFHGKSRSTAFAAFSAGAPVGGGLGLVLGGVLTEYSKYTWRSTFFVFAGLAAGIAICAWFVIPNDELHTRDRRIDWVGAALVTIGLIFIQFAISDGEVAPDEWKTWYIILLLILGVGMTIAFFYWESYIVKHTSRPPLMRLQLWTRANGKLASIYFIGFVSWAGFITLIYHTTLYFQQVQDTGVIDAMLRFLPTSIWGFACNVIVAFLVSRVPTQWLVCVGILATGLASVLMALSSRTDIYWRYSFNAMWMGVMGADFLMACGSIFVAALALPEEQSVAGALFQTLVQLGGSFGLAITTVISDRIETQALAKGYSATDSLLQGLHAAFWLGAACSFLALVAAVLMLRGMGKVGKVVKEHPVEEEVPEKQDV